MKKITAFIFSLVVVFSCYTVTAQAAEQEVTENISITKPSTKVTHPKKKKR